MPRIVKKTKFLKGGTNLAKTRKFPGIYGPRYAAPNSNNRRVRQRG